MFSMVFERLKNQEAKAACMLPNQARYQLRYIPMILFLRSQSALLARLRANRRATPRYFFGTGIL